MHTQDQLKRYADEIVQLEALIAKEVGPTHSFFYYTARLNERRAILGAK